uniref:Putative secreted protein n=1 Tax=Ixodes ricinus TaxID=34613 RepID=A0A6B0U7Y8_IXORI
MFCMAAARICCVSSLFTSSIESWSSDVQARSEDWVKPSQLALSNFHRGSLNDSVGGGRQRSRTTGK